MKKFNKILRLSGLVLLMFLASVGIGITGAAPIFPGNKQRIVDNETKIELVEEKKKTKKSTQLGEFLH